MWLSQQSSSFSLVNFFAFLRFPTADVEKFEWQVGRKESLGWETVGEIFYENYFLQILL